MCVCVCVYICMYAYDSIYSMYLCLMGCVHGVWGGGRHLSPQYPKARYHAWH